MPENTSYRNRRKFIRYRPDPFDYVQIDSRANEGDFNPDSLALIVDESSGGIGLLMDQRVSLKDGNSYLIKIGNQNPRLAKVVWRFDLPLNTARVGVEFSSPL